MALLFKGHITWALS